jgi:hypothetical protein
MSFSPAALAFSSQGACHLSQKACQRRIPWHRYRSCIPIIQSDIPCSEGHFQRPLSNLDRIKIHPGSTKVVVIVLIMTCWRGGTPNLANRILNGIHTFQYHRPCRTRIRRFRGLDAQSGRATAGTMAYSYSLQRQNQHKQLVYCCTGVLP